MHLSRDELYGYDLEKAVGKFPIQELNDPDQKKQLLTALKKGDLHPVTMNVDGKETKLYIDANPRFRTLNVGDEAGNTVRRENIGKEDLSKTPKMDEALNKDKKQTQKQGKGKGITTS